MQKCFKKDNVHNNKRVLGLGYVKLRLAFKQEKEPFRDAYKTWPGESINHPVGPAQGQPHGPGPWFILMDRT